MNVPLNAPLNAISRLLAADPASVVLDARANSKDALFQLAAEALATRLALQAKPLQDALFTREQLGSTGLGQGVGIPHGRLKGLKQAAGMFCRLAKAIPFEAPDNRPVDLVFFLLVPEQGTEEHLQLLSELAQGFSDPEFRQALRTAPDAANVSRLFAGSH